jgi:rRNA maturation RNase YbeY
MDNVLSRLKKQYFGLNQLTDVIAFRYNEESDEKLEGEIYISLQRAKDNANSFNEPLKKEIARLIIHGCLHLIGFDDDTKKSKNEMTNWEEIFLKKVDWNYIINN